MILSYDIVVILHVPGFVQNHIHLHIFFFSFLIFILCMSIELMCRVILLLNDTNHSTNYGGCCSPNATITILRH